MPGKTAQKGRRAAAGRDRIGGSTSTGALKILALICMLTDHAGKMLFPNVPEMRLIGRIAFPLYCWCLVVGMEYTSSPLKYLERILLCGLLSQPLYMLALNHTWTEPNIMWTLSLGVAAIWAIRGKKLLSQIWGPCLCLYLAQFTHADYGFRGVLLILMLYAVRSSRGGIASVMCAFCMYWGTTSSVLRDPFGIPLSAIANMSFYPLLAPFLRLQAMAILALPFMLIQLPWNPKMPKWLGYALYPMHLLLLLLLEQFM
ncbi:MAG: hypothetical protein IJ083_13450 [Clostridia bacterium]|nr:hypothetical protein [Clostridia bacterium]